MTRSDLVEQLLAKFPQLSPRDADLTVKILLDAMSEALVRGDPSQLRRVLVNVLAAIRALGRLCPFLKNSPPISSLAKPCAQPSMPTANSAKRCITSKPAR